MTGLVLEMLTHLKKAYWHWDAKIKCFIVKVFFALKRVNLGALICLSEIGSKAYL